MLATFVLQRRWHKCKQDAPSSNGDDFRPGVCISNLCLLAFLLPQHTWKTLPLLTCSSFSGNGSLNHLWVTDNHHAQRPLRMFENRLLPSRQKSIARKHRPTECKLCVLISSGSVRCRGTPFLHMCNTGICNLQNVEVLLLIRFISSNDKCDAFRLCNILNEALVTHAEGNLNHP